MKGRKSMRQSKSKKYFRSAADRVHKFNLQHKPMRGGYRL
jgi:hypothetical protein